MIKSLHLVNFETHKDSLIEFCPKINVIRGSTDQGKSTIRRALTYVVFSKPVQGRADDKTKDSYVTLRCTGIPPITRGRTGGKKGKNYYKIGSKEFSGEEVDSLKAIKRTVPEEISQMIDLSEINIQEQFKEYYLLQSTAGQVAKTIHSLLGMDMVDKTAKVANSAIKAQAALLKSRKTQIENIEADIKKYAYVEELEDKLSDLETAIQDYEELEARSHNLTALLERFRILQQRMAANKIPQMVEDEARSLMAEILKLNEKQIKIDKLYKAVKATDEISKKQRELKEWLQIENEAIELQKEIVDFQTREVKRQRLVALIEQLEDRQARIANVREVLRYNTKKLDELK
ncbi:MAG: AAA family ATPase, partial [Proteobacteria bacterium]|nr:AAA family ATPase [Pseudomonadota bacterium]